MGPVREISVKFITVKLLGLTTIWTGLSWITIAVLVAATEIFKAW